MNASKDKLRSAALPESEICEYLFWCGGCKCPHVVRVKGPGAWGWNGSTESPTFTPSVLVWTGAFTGGVKENVCHSYVTDGKIQYLPDSLHELAGKTVELDPWSLHEDWGINGE